jgi:hypothetical protein
LHTHRLLGRIIKKKSSNLIEKYSDVQRAYLYIKSNTNIVDMNKILRKMEHQDDMYDAALKKVNAMQNELNLLEKEMAQAYKRHEQIYSMDGQSI